MDRPSLLIAIPTYRRPEKLERLLELLQLEVEECRRATLIDGAQLLVIDNDPSRSAEQTVARAHGDIRYVNELEPGVVAVRNTALQEAAGSDLLAFIDDDELPEPHWLSELVKTWMDTGATLVSGRVIAHFESKPEPWIAAGRFFVRRQLHTGARLTVASTNSLLLDVKRLTEYGVRFDPRMSLTGGEDTLFSRQLHRAGAKMVWAADSTVLDLVPDNRATRSWVLTRARSHGNSTAAVELMLCEPGVGRWRARTKLATGGLARTVIGSLRAAFGALTKNQVHHARGLRAANRGVGMTIGAAGLVYREYAREGERRWSKLQLSSAGTQES